MRRRTHWPGNGYTKIPSTEHLIIFDKFQKGLNQAQLAKEYGVTPTNIRYILKKNGYKPKSRNSGAS